MAFDPDAFLASTSSGTAQSGFDPDKFLADTETSSDYWADVERNARQAWKELPGMVVAIGEQAAKVNPVNQPMRAIQSVREIIQGKPIMETQLAESAKASGDLAKGIASGVWQGVKDTGSLIKAPFEWLGGEDLAETDIGKKYRERPYGVPLGIAGTVPLMGSGLKALRGAKAATGAGAATEDVATAGIPKEGPIPGKGPIPEPEMPPGKPPPPGASTPPPGVDPLSEVFKTVEEKFGRAQKTPGLTQNLGKALEQKGRGMRLKEIGASPGQVRQLKDRFGETMVNDLADLADEKGISKGFFNWQTGDAIKKLDQTAGRQLGALRDIVSKRGAVHDNAAMIQQIRSELDPIYMQGTGSVQKGAYLKALKDIQNSPSDVAGMANTITNTNKFIAKNKLTLPLGAPRKVMQVATRLNNELAGKYMNPKELALYEENLKDVAAAKVFDKMYGFTYGRDMAGRTGPGGIFNFVKDVGGRKIMEKVYSNVGRGMQKMTGGLPEIKTITSDILEAIDDALDEVIDQMGGGAPPQGMAFGGIVGEMDAYLTPRYGGKE